MCFTDDDLEKLREHVGLEEFGKTINNISAIDKDTAATGASDNSKLKTQAQSQ